MLKNCHLKRKKKLLASEQIHDSNLISHDLSSDVHSYSYNSCFNSILSSPYAYTFAEKPASYLHSYNWVVGRDHVICQ